MRRENDSEQIFPYPAQKNTYNKYPCRMIVLLYGRIFMFFNRNSRLYRTQFFYFFTFQNRYTRVHLMRFTQFLFDHSSKTKLIHLKCRVIFLWKLMKSDGFLMTSSRSTVYWNRYTFFAMFRVSALLSHCATHTIFLCISGVPRIISTRVSTYTRIYFFFLFLLITKKSSATICYNNIVVKNKI